MKKIILSLLTILFLTPAVVFATTTVPWSTASITNPFLFPNTVNGKNPNQFYLNYPNEFLIATDTDNVFIDSTPSPILNTSFGTDNFNALTGAGSVITSGSFNTFIGYHSGFFTTTGSYNSGFGETALFNNSTGNYNYAAGLDAGYGNTTGSYNFFLGKSAGQTNTTGNYNFYGGYNAGFSNNNSGGVAIGYQSMLNATGASTTAVGYGTGNTDITGNSNSYFGYQADAKSSGLTNITVLGANALASSSNSLILGNYNVNVGIGTSSPGTILSLGSSTNYINFGITGTSTFSKGLNITSGCYAISGTCISGGGSGANPTALVGLSAVNGSATTFLRSDGAPALDQSIAPTWTGLHTYSPTITGSSGSKNVLTLTPTISETGSGTYEVIYTNVTESSTGSGTKYLLDLNVGGSNKFYVDSLGNARLQGTLDMTAGGQILSQNFDGQNNGFGVTLFQIFSNGVWDYFVGGRNTAQTFFNINHNGDAVTNSSGNFSYFGIAPVYNQTGTAGGVDFYINRTETALGSGPQHFIDLDVAGVTKFTVTDTGTTGIGTSTPDSALDVNGTVRFEGTSTVVTGSISGAIVGLGCDSADTTVSGGLSSTTAFVTTPQTYPGDGLNWFSYLLNPTTIRTKVCSDVTVTPTASVYTVKIIK
jgi:hypothetical protein